MSIFIKFCLKTLKQFTILLSFLIYVCINCISLQSKEHPAAVELHSGSVRKRQDQSKRQLESLRQIHGHQLRLQRGSRGRAHQQLFTGKSK